MFLGRYTSESLGDYCAGPNHVLPTSRTARFSSPLGVYDFQKRSSVIEVSEAGAQTLGEIAAELAYGEGLQAHARSAEYRMKKTSAELKRRGDLLELRRNGRPQSRRSTRETGRAKHDDTARHHPPRRARDDDATPVARRHRPDQARRDGKSVRAARRRSPRSSASSSRASR